VATTKVGVIGLGAMGGALAERVMGAGFATEVFDLDRAAIDRLVAMGASAGTMASVAVCGVVIINLPNDAIVTDVGEQLAGNLGDATRVIEMSSISPQTARRLRDTLGAAEFVDSPVSGGPMEARNGELSLLVGTDAPVSETARAVLEAVGTINEVGTVGDGKAVKLVNQMMAMGNNAIAVEAFQLGVNLGVDPELLYDVLSRSGGRSNHFNKRIPWAIADDFDARFAIRLAEKDLRLAIELGHDNTYATPITATIHQVYERAMTQELADEDVVSLIKLYRRR
jgi:3-hydroxyisobutyrate dehydrogenase-like beta-hydroxyacid dehydrogenase